MSEHPIQGLTNTAMQSIKDMIDVNTIIGDTINAPDGTLIIPISKVTLGFGSGGSEFPTKIAQDSKPFGGGTGAGISIIPVAFLVIKNDEVKLLQISESSGPVEKLINVIPEFLDKIQGMISKKEKE